MLLLVYKYVKSKPVFLFQGMDIFNLPQNGKLELIPAITYFFLAFPTMAKDLLRRDVYSFGLVMWELLSYCIDNMHNNTGVWESTTTQLRL